MSMSTSTHIYPGAEYGTETSGSGAILISIDQGDDHLALFFHHPDTLEDLHRAVITAREKAHVAQVYREFGEDGRLSA